MQNNVIPTLAYILIVLAAFAGLLTLNPLPVQAGDNQCGTATIDASTEWTAHEVTCDEDDDLTYATNSAGLTNLDAIAYYLVPKRATGLKVTLTKGITINGWPDAVSGGLVFNDGLRVQATNSKGLAKGIWVVSEAKIESGSGGGISVKSRGSGDIPITIDVLSGMFGIVGGSGVKIDAENGDVTINFAGTIADHIGDGEGGFNTVDSGIDIYRNDSARGDIAITLKDGAKIVAFEAEENGIDNGIHIHDEHAPRKSSSSTMQVVTEKDTTIGSDNVPVNLNGIRVWIQYSRATNAKKDVTITHNGKIYAKNKGIIVEHGGSGVPSNNNRGKGTATVTIGDDGIVTVQATETSNFGIFLNTPDTVSAGGIRKQSVTVHGQVYGGNNAGAIELQGGGTVTVGPKAKLVPSGASDSYKSVKVTSPDGNAQFKNLVIQFDRHWQNFPNIDNGVNGQAKTDLQYRNTADGEYAAMTTGTKVVESQPVTGVPCGIYNDCVSTESIVAKVTDPDSTTGVFSVNFEPSIDVTRTAPTNTDGTDKTAVTRDPSRRGRVYAGLPAVLSDITGAITGSYVPAVAPAGDVRVAQSGTMMPTELNASAPRGGWGHIAGGRGERRLQRQLTSGDLSYKLSHGSFAAGVDLPAEQGLVYRVGLHRQQAKAQITDGGSVAIAGIGAGVGIARALADGLTVHGWLAATRFNDIEVMSSDTKNKIDIDETSKGTGYSLSLGVSKQLTFGGLALTQRGDLRWSSVSMKDFIASYTAQVQSSVPGQTTGVKQQETIAMQKVSGLTGRYGVMLEGEYEDASGTCCRLFGSLDLEHNFQTKRQVKVSGAGFPDQIDVSKSKPTSMRLGFGGSKSWNNSESAISAAVYHSTAGRGNSMLSGSIAVSVRF